MNDAGPKKAKLRLVVVGPFEGETEWPIGATAWISAADDEPIVVRIPIGYAENAATLELDPGRIVVVLRCPSGARGRREIHLSAGQEVTIEFGKAHRQVETAQVVSTQLPPAFGSGKPPEQPMVDPLRVEQTGSSFGFGGGSLGPPTIDWYNYPGLGNTQKGTAEWMPEIHKVRILRHERSGSKLHEWVLRKGHPPKGISWANSSTQSLDIGAPDCLAFVVETSAPFQNKVLLHCAASTRDALTFTVRPRPASSPIPIDSEVTLSDGRIMSLLAFLANGDVPSARAQAVGFVEVADGYLRAKFANHHLAAVGAYALYVLGLLAGRENWIRELYARFNDLSDGPILYAMQLIRSRPGAISEWYDEARNALVEATRRPIPMLTMGVHLLVEGLRRLSSSKRALGDEELARALVRARWIQSRARPDEVFTALWLDKHELREALLPYDYDTIAQH